MREGREDRPVAAVPKYQNDTWACYCQSKMPRGCEWHCACATWPVLPQSIATRARGSAAVSSGTIIHHPYVAIYWRSSSSYLPSLHGLPYQVYTCTHFEPYLEKQLFWSCDWSEPANMLQNNNMDISPPTFIHIVHFHVYMGVQAKLCMCKLTTFSVYCILLHSTRRKYICEYNILFRLHP